MPDRKYQAGSASYRYSINGQEKEFELNENITTAEHWEYDSRIGRRWNIDPVLKEWESGYATFRNNPIYSSDKDGLDAKTPDEPKVKTLQEVIVMSKPGKKKKKETANQNKCPQQINLSDMNLKSPIVPKWSIRIGDTWGPVGANERTSIWGIYGNPPQYYNSTPNGVGGLIKNITEPNVFAQLQMRIGDEDSKSQIGINWFKQKFRPFSNGFRYEAPTAVELSFSRPLNLLDVGNNLNISANLSVSAGPTFGKSLFDQPSQGTVYGKAGYHVIGWGGSFISRVDFTLFTNYTFFVAGTLHHLQTSTQSTSIGTEPSRGIGSGSLTIGAGFNLGGR